MAFRSCAYFNCKNKKNKETRALGVMLFSFPSNEDLLIKWVNACQNRTLINYHIETIVKQRTVCSEHFHHLSFINPLRSFKRLKKDAVPNLCENLQSYYTAQVKDGICVILEGSESPLATQFDFEVKGQKATSEVNKKPKLHEDISSPSKIIKHVLAERCPVYPISSYNEKPSNVESPILSQPLSTFAAEDIYGNFIEQEEIAPVYTNTVKRFKGKEEKNIVLNLAGLNIRRLEKTEKKSEVSNTTSLILDNNYIQTLPNIYSYKKLTKLSLSNNKIDSLIWFRRLESLKILNLSNNFISEVDALWKMWHLIHVDLSGNQIEEIKACNADSMSNIESLNFSNNKIVAVGNLSMLSNLKELLLHQNTITSLNNCRRYLPSSLTHLTLSENLIRNLNDISELSHLEALKSLTLSQNPCLNVLQLIDSQGNLLGAPRNFDYRPFVFTWCPNLIHLDKRKVCLRESSKALRLLSKGKIRGTDAQNHARLVTYLSEMCPMDDKDSSSYIDDQLVTVSKNREEEPQLKLKFFNNSNTKKCKHNNNVFSAPELSLHNKNGECSSSPCKHYIELIEEKARCHKLLRSKEGLLRTNEDALERVHLLETVLSQNGFSIDDLVVRMEKDVVKEEDNL